MGPAHLTRRSHTEARMMVVLRSSTFAPLTAMFMLLLMLPGLSFGVQVNELLVPEPAVVGRSAVLECNWSSPDFYSIRWYKDDDNFFTIIPKTKVKTAPSVHGISVDVDASNLTVVVLRDVVAQTAGEYKCEIMGEKPHFVTSHLTKTLTVAEVPGGVELTGLVTHYRVGELLNITCTVHNARPAAHISFYIDDKEVSPYSGFSQVPIQSGYVLLDAPKPGDKRDTYTTRGNLQLRLNRQHVPRTRVRCLGRISSLVPLEIQRVILVDEPQPNHASLNTGCSSTWRCEVLLPMAVVCISFVNHILLKYS